MRHSRRNIERKNRQKENKKKHYCKHINYTTDCTSTQLRVCECAIAKFIESPSRMICRSFAHKHVERCVDVYSIIFAILIKPSVIVSTTNHFSIAAISAVHSEQIVSDSVENCSAVIIYVVVLCCTFV